MNKKRTQGQSEVQTKAANDNLTTETIKETKELATNTEEEEIISDNLGTTIEMNMKAGIMAKEKTIEILTIETEILTNETIITTVEIDSTIINTQEKDKKEKAKTQTSEITTDMINQTTTGTITMSQERTSTSGRKNKSLSRPKILWMRIKLITDRS